MMEENMDQRTYDAFRKIIYDKAGIALGTGKQALVHARLAKRLRKLSLSDYDAYLRYLLEDESGEEIVQLLDVISTNTTSFFRESIHFDMLREILADWLQKGKRRFRVWCAAASTGEEPYTLSMVCQEAFGSTSVDFRILATDISTKVLRQCKLGEYPIDKMNGIPDGLIEKYFEPTAVRGIWSATPILRAPITFARLNLMESPYPMSGPFDVVFCRNVMIYFDKDGRKKFVDEAHRLLAPGGYLFSGHSESLTGLVQGMKCIKPSVYQKI